MENSDSNMPVSVSSFHIDPFEALWALAQKHGRSLSSVKLAEKREPHSKGVSKPVLKIQSVMLLVLGVD